LDKENQYMLVWFGSAKWFWHNILAQFPLEGGGE